MVNMVKSTTFIHDVQHALAVVLLSTTFTFSGPRPTFSMVNDHRPDQ